MSAPPEVVRSIVRMVMKRMPEAQSFHAVDVSLALFKYLHNLPADDPVEQDIMDAVQEALTVRDGDKTYVVGTEAGAAAATEWPSLEAYAAAQDGIEKLAEDAGGAWSPWVCTKCHRTWEDGTEPDQFCPDCGITISRLKVVGKDHPQYAEGMEMTRPRRQQQ